jgi:hypothetical protein
MRMPCRWPMKSQYLNARQSLKHSISKSSSLREICYYCSMSLQQQGEATASSGEEAAAAEADPVKNLFTLKVHPTTEWRKKSANHSIMTSTCTPLC